MRGAFELKTPYDLLQKLRHDLDELKRNPTSTYAAFNFFVTAEHMKDWAYPGKANRADRESLGAASPLLQVCSHLANGAKHFVAEAKHHRSVADTGRTGGHSARGYWPAGHWAPGHWARGALVVELQGDAARLLGPNISAVELAKQVFAFWESRPEAAKP